MSRYAQKNFGHRDPEIRSHDATENRPRYNPARPASTHPFKIHTHAPHTMTLRRDALPAAPQRTPISNSSTLRIVLIMLSCLIEAKRA